MFYLDIALAVVPLALLAVVLSYEAHATERVHLGTHYRSQIDGLEKRVASRENILHLLSDYQTGAITIFDRHNRYWFVNKVAAKSLSMEPDEIVGRPPIKILSNEQAKKLEAKLAQARAENEPLEYIETVTEKDGTIRFVQNHLKSWPMPPICTAAFCSAKMILRR
jgi:PAS domain S-box-containing protein